MPNFIVIWKSSGLVLRTCFTRAEAEHHLARFPGQLSLGTIVYDWKTSNDQQD